MPKSLHQVGNSKRCKLPHWLKWEPHFSVLVNLRQQAVREAQTLQIVEARLALLPSLLLMMVPFRSIRLKIADHLTLLARLVTRPHSSNNRISNNNNNHSNSNCNLFRSNWRFQVSRRQEWTWTANFNVCLSRIRTSDNDPRLKLVRINSSAEWFESSVQLAGISNSEHPWTGKCPGHSSFQPASPNWTTDVVSIVNWLSTASPSTRHPNYWYATRYTLECLRIIFIDFVNSRFFAGSTTSTGSQWSHQVAGSDHRQPSRYPTRDGLSFDHGSSVFPSTTGGNDGSCDGHRNSIGYCLF